MHTEQTLQRPHPVAHAPAPVFRYEDPLDPDAYGEATVVTTRRQLIRIALVAAETASRFEREAIEHDPVAWMLAPRRLYGGASAIDACLERKACLRTVLLHGLSMGLDADPAEIDDLSEDDGFEERVPHEPSGDSIDAEDDLPPVPSAAPVEWRSCLYTTTSERRSEFGFVQSFGAVVADGMAAATAAFAEARGDWLGEGSVVREGFDASDPLAEALLSPSVSDMLRMVAENPWSPLARGLSVWVEQRFAE